MLKLVSDISELSFLPADPFSAVITSLAKTYGTERDFVRFYIQENYAALSILDGNVNIYADENADIEEIKVFLDMMGYASVRADKKLIDKLGLKTDDTSYIVKYIGNEVPRPDGFVDDYDFKKVYNLLVSAGFELPDYSAYVTDICSRINKGAASFGGIASDNIDSCCFRLFEGEKSILLGAVATAKSARGKGLASALVPYMAWAEKPAFLFTRNDKLLDFYKNCGFEKYGNWAISYQE